MGESMNMLVLDELASRVDQASARMGELRRHL
jgi:hypothetical protein